MKKSRDFFVAVLASLFAVGGLGAAYAVEPNGDDGVIEDVTDGSTGDGDFIDPVDTGEGVGVIDDTGEDSGVIDDGTVDDGVIDVVEDTGEDSGGIDDGTVDGGEVIEVVEDAGDGEVPAEGEDPGDVEYADGGGEVDVGEVSDGEVLELAGEINIYTMADFGDGAGAIEESAEPVEALDITDEIGGDVESAREARARRR